MPLSESREARQDWRAILRDFVAATTPLIIVGPRPIGARLLRACTSLRSSTGAWGRS